MSITNKLIANIKQTNVDVTRFTDTNNVICIDTSNNRLGINTKTPRYAIDICGINSKIFVENLEVGKNANLFTVSANTISANTITCNDASFTRILDVSFINVKTISGSLIKGLTLSGNTILGRYGNIRDISAHNITISNTLDVSFIIVNEISANKFKFGSFDFDTVNTNRTTTNTLIASTVSCETLKAKSIRCSQTLSADIISSDNLISKDGLKYFEKDANGDIVLKTGLGSVSRETVNSIVTQTINSNNALPLTRSSITTTTANITQSATIDDTLIVKNIKINTTKAGYGLLLPEKPNNSSNFLDRSLAVNTNSDNHYFDNLIYYNSYKAKWSNFFTETHYATLDLSSISSKNLATNYVSNLTNYRYIPIKFKSIKTNANNNYITKTDLFFIPSSSPTNSSIDICNADLMNNGIYEINASITLSYTNTISGDVEPNDYTFGLYNKDAFTPTYTTTTTSNIEISYNYVKNKNLILAFDNSYNFSSVSLHYIGPLYSNYDPNPQIDYRKGLCYLINSQKDISNFNVEYFSSTIKLLNFLDY